MKRILSIEDNPLMANLLEKSLGKIGDFEFVTARDPDEGIKELEKKLPDLLLLDLLFSDKSGLSVLEYMAEDNQRSKVPVVVYTNAGDERIKERALSMGVKEYVLKEDSTINELLEILKKYL